MLAERPTTIPAFATMDEVAETLRVTRRTVDNLRHRGELATVLVGRRRLVPMTELSRFLEAARRERRV
jgi:excisionase family DNA binding protein